MSKPTLTHITMRDSGEYGTDTDFECRFSDGQKFAAVQMNNILGDDIAAQILNLLRSNIPDELENDPDFLCRNEFGQPCYDLLCPVCKAAHNGPDKSPCDWCSKEIAEDERREVQRVKAAARRADRVKRWKRFFAWLAFWRT